MQTDYILDNRPVFPENEGGTTRRLDYLGYAPCPIRHELQNRLHAYFGEKQAAKGKLEWYSPGGCGSGNDPYDLIWQTGGENDMPGVISDGGSSDYFRREGHARWVATGIYGPFDKPAGLVVRPELADAGIMDPLGAICIYATFPSVFLVDTQLLGQRPAPKCWADLANPIYRGDISISGWADEVPDVLLFNMWSKFGQGTLEAFAQNVRNFWSPAEMVKAAGSSNPNGTAIYVMNLFFAKSCPRRQIVNLVWPEEGAWFSPLSVLAKRERRPQSQLAIDYLFGEDWARYLDGVGVPSVYQRPGQKPLPGKLAWMGWDFVRGNDIDALRIELNRVFSNARNA